MRTARWVAGLVSAVIAGLVVAVLTQQIAFFGPNIDDRPAMYHTLAEGQLSERVSVTIAGRSVGTLTVDVVHRAASLTVTVPAPGTYRYELASSAVESDSGGDPVQLVGKGLGQIPVTAGRSFAVVG